MHDYRVSVTESAFSVPGWNFPQLGLQGAGADVLF